MWQFVADNLIYSYDLAHFELQLIIFAQVALRSCEAAIPKMVLLHLWSKFGDPSLNGSRGIARTSKWLIHTHTDTQTDTGNDNTRRPKLASGKHNMSSHDVNIPVIGLGPMFHTSMVKAVTLPAEIWHEPIQSHCSFLHVNTQQEG